MYTRGKKKTKNNKVKVEKKRKGPTVREKQNTTKQTRPHITSQKARIMPYSHQALEDEPDLWQLATMWNEKAMIFPWV